MRLRYSTRAREQIDEIHAYIARDKPTAATNVVERVRAAAERLSRFPHIGHVGVVDGTFEWVVRGLPYIIVYQIDENRGELIILNVFHGAQDRRRDEGEQ
jgi:plasmid stabilization system protein ParE